MPLTVLPDIMTAYRLIPGSPDPVRQEIPVPTLAPDQVLVRVLAAGVCHSDTFFLSAEINDPRTYILGHENVGVAVK